ncbi:MAG TPA: tRNA pseudouridine(38-40) synthase TruA [Longimicrobiales bacterium]
MSNPGAERRIKLTLHYDGADFFGWQVQPGVRTVQAELEQALSRLADKPVTAVAAGRTDRGVHATGQVASALMPGKWTAAALQRALNAILPQDVWIADATEIGTTFHARYDAVSRSYYYRVGTSAEAWSPFQRRWCWPLRAAPDLVLLNDAAQRFAGTHSFRAFAKSGQPERGDQCTVSEARWSRWSHGMQFDVTANRFLHHMVRYMVGTMVDVGLRRRPAADVDELLRGSGETSVPAPPQGLFLAHVDYGEKVGLEALNTRTAST